MLSDRLQALGVFLVALCVVVNAATPAAQRMYNRLLASICIAPIQTTMANATVQATMSCSF
jgi:hypothetical protein